jgi:lipid II:glycine glycyltransferase (peptidoglycan interpeptide bridge formation enzyme)
VCAWKLIEVLNDMDINEFDLAGIDPEENEGVFNFKKGLGGQRHTYLGEWETSAPSAIKQFLGPIVSRMG